VLTAAINFLGTYLVLAVGRLPGFRVDRTGAAIIGAGLMIAFNVLTLEEAYASSDHNTIVLLFGMMIVIPRAKRYVSISFWEYFKVGLPLTLATIAVGAFFLR
jgi:Na+/H+ antiporter NhaD/arsenite permease-like protein